MFYGRDRNCSRRGGYSISPASSTRTPAEPSLERENTQNCCNILITGTLKWCRRRESNDTRLLILRNLLQTYERKNRKTRCMPASTVQNHVQSSKAA